MSGTSKAPAHDVLGNNSEKITMSENQAQNTSQPTDESMAAIIGELVKRVNRMEKAFSGLGYSNALTIEALKCCRLSDSEGSTHINKADQVSGIAFADFEGISEENEAA